jgi:ATP-dependent RNA helicase RhlE
MLDMGFIHDVRWIAEQVPTPRQTLLFSATISPAVRSLASSLQTDPKSVAVAPPSTVADNIDQQVVFVESTNKIHVLTELVSSQDTDRALVFTGTKSAASRVARQLELKGVVADAIHSDKTQSQRMRSLDKFTQGKVQVLVATDIVARGIDVEGITHVVNYDLPQDPENYVHRIGRTARAGKAGVAVSLCGVEDVSNLRGVQRLLKEPLHVQVNSSWHSPMVAACVTASARKTKTRSRGPRFG